jgi:hypothetical protein
MYQKNEENSAAMMIRVRASHRFLLCCFQSTAVLFVLYCSFCTMMEEKKQRCSPVQKQVHLAITHCYETNTKKRLPTTLV